MYQGGPQPVGPWQHSAEQREREQKEGKERGREQMLSVVALGAAAIVPIVPILAIIASAPLLVTLVLVSAPSLEPSIAFAFVCALAVTLCIAVILVFILLLGLVLLYPDLTPAFLTRSRARSGPPSPQPGIIQPSLPAGFIPHTEYGIPMPPPHEIAPATQYAPPPITPPIPTRRRRYGWSRGN